MHAHTLTCLLTAALLPLSVLAQGKSGSGKTTRYWDCCKPSCAWGQKASVNQPVTTCDKNDSPVGVNVKSGCDNGGSAFTCSNNAPWAVNDQLAYGFAATAIAGGNEASWCCACYALTFTDGPPKGKTMVVQSTNTGGDLSNNHFDILMPGGGLGIFDGCSPQYGMTFPGARYGGVSSKSECTRLPAKLQAGCDWRFDWFGGADNPNINFKQVRCPDELVSRSGCRRSDDSSMPVFTPPAATTPQTTAGSSSAGSTAGSGSSSGAALWAQCGTDAEGPSPCAENAACVSVNQYYHQCQPASR